MAQYIFSVDGNYVNFNGGGNLWRLHKDSNCVAWHWDQTGDLFFDVYDQQYVVKAADIGNVVIGGVTLTTAADFETNIKIVFPGLAGGGGSLGYLVYTALISQTPPAAPTAIVLENTLGGTVVLTRTGVGAYDLTLAGAFVDGKTFFPGGFVLEGASYMSLGGATTIFDRGYTIFWTDVNTVSIYSFLANFTPEELGTLIGENARLCIEIRVYP